MANGVFSISLNAFRDIFKMFSNDSAYEVEDDENVGLSAEQTEALSNVSSLGNKIEKEQGNSIHLSMNELVIRANNGVEFFLKKMKVNEKIKDLIEKISPKEEREPDLPKEGFVKQAEETKVKVDSKRAVEEARARGGEVRERKGR